MEVEQQTFNSKNFLPFEEIYYLELQKINGVYFTKREIDIIACVLSGKTAKKIASFLVTVQRRARDLINL